MKNGKCNEAKKQSSKPRRPLSAYNLFFQYERQKIIAEQKTQGDNDGSNDGVGSEKIRARVGFANLASMISKRWKNIDPVYKKELERQAKVEKIEYKKKIDAWRRRNSVTDPEEEDAFFITNKTDASNWSLVQGQNLFSVASMHNDWFNGGAPLNGAGSMNVASFNQHPYLSPIAVAYAKVDTPSVNTSEGHQGLESFTFNNVHPPFGRMLGYDNAQSVPFPERRTSLPEIVMTTMSGAQHSRSQSLFPCVQNEMDHENIFADAYERPIEEIQRFFGIDPEKNRIEKQSDKDKRRSSWIY